MRKIIQLLGKYTGIASGVGVCGGWIFAMWSPTSVLPLTGIAFGVAMLMTLFAIIAVIASLRGHGITLMVLFFVSFFPIGSFLLGLPGWLWLIGILNLGYLIAGLIAWRMPAGNEQSTSSDTE